MWLPRAAALPQPPCPIPVGGITKLLAQEAHTGACPALALPPAPLPKPSILCRALLCILAVVWSASSPKNNQANQALSLCPLPVSVELSNEE